MVGNIENGGLVERWKSFNKFTRNGAIGIAIAGAALGFPAIIVPALMSAGIDQLQNVGIEKYQSWRKSGGQIFP